MCVCVFSYVCRVAVSVPRCLHHSPGKQAWSERVSHERASISEDSSAPGVGSRALHKTPHALHQTPAAAFCVSLLGPSVTRNGPSDPTSLGLKTSRVPIHQSSTSSRRLHWSMILTRTPSRPPLPYPSFWLISIAVCNFESPRRFFPAGQKEPIRRASLPSLP